MFARNSKTAAVSSSTTCFPCIVETVFIIVWALTATDLFYNLDGEGNLYPASRFVARIMSVFCFVSNKTELNTGSVGCFRKTFLLDEGRR